MTITVTLREDPSSDRIGINLLFEVISPTQNRFCTYMTPFEGFAGNILDVRDRNGTSMPYLGRMIKRHPPTSKDYMTLPANKAKVICFNLINHYKIPPTGPISVQFRKKHHLNALPDSNILTIRK
jgi:hypothetical protein